MAPPRILESPVSLECKRLVIVDVADPTAPRLVGTAPADLYVFSPSGQVKASRVASEVYGPFGMVVAGPALSSACATQPRLATT